jgi:hypothetical protein
MFVNVNNFSAVVVQRMSRALLEEEAFSAQDFGTSVEFKGKYWRIQVR